MKKLVILLNLALLGACSSDKEGTTEIDDKTVCFNNFEGSGGWSNDPGRNNASLVKKGNGHSGQYALVVDKDHEFSLTYDMPLGQISSSKFKTLHLDAWVYMTSEKGAATIGMQIMAPDNYTSLGGGDVKFTDVVKKYNEWVPISKDFPLPDNITSAQHLRLFMWRAGATEPVLLDDVKLSIKD